MYLFIVCLTILPVMHTMYNQEINSQFQYLLLLHHALLNLYILFTHQQMYFLLNLEKFKFILKYT
jgi:hypothetical protein